MATPLLSVTVLNYNYGRFLADCLQSILAQTFRDFELIVIDDCSRDGSIEVIAPFLSDPRVKLVAHETNRGFQASLIEGTEVFSRGKYCTVISADDMVLRADAFERQMEMLAANPGAVLAFSSFAHVFEDGATLIRHAAPESTVFSSREAFMSFLLNNKFWALHSGSIFARDAYLAAGGYRGDIAMPLDLGLWFPLSLQGDVAYTTEVLYGYRMHGSQMSTARMKLHASEVARIVADACEAGEQHGLNTARLRRKAIGTHLGGTILHEAFSSPRSEVMARIAACFCASPVAVTTSPYLWVSLLRAALGRAGYDALRRARNAASFNKRARREPVTL